MKPAPNSQQEEIDALKAEIAALKNAGVRQGIRKRSSLQIFGMPVFALALGPNPKANEMFGHAKGIVAIGDIATGFVAVGGVARGVVAVGGVALGLISLGGCAIGLLAAFGGLAIGGLAIGGLAIGVIAMGGAAIGYAVIGGTAVGYYACGATTIGQHVINGVQQDPQAVKLIEQFLPGAIEMGETPVN